MKTDGLVKPSLMKTSIRLADGRTLIYFDELPADRGARDRRAIAPLPPQSEARYDPVLDQWVIVADHRQSRTFLPAADDCPLCPSTPDHSTEIPAADYDVVVFENRFPALASQPGATSAGGLFDHRSGHGRCEVVCFTSDHDRSFAELSETRVATILDVWTDRTRALSEVPGVEYVFVFENRGEEIGVTLSHPHGQIYGYPFVPPAVLQAIHSAERHRQRSGGCLFCDQLSAEVEAGGRIVAETSCWVAFVPYAARWPFELRVQPRRHLADLGELDAAEREEFPGLYLELLARLDGVFDTKMPYIAAWQQTPVRIGRELIHLSLQIFSTRRAPTKLKYLAGSESAAGVFVNDIAPEDAAAMLRDTVPTGEGLGS